jgi:hypothetical protein
MDFINDRHAEREKPNELPVARVACTGNIRRILIKA